MTVYMIVEDDQTKSAAYRKFERHYAASGVEFRTMDSARTAIITLQNPDERAEFAGVIADFDLGHRPDTPHKRIDVTDTDGQTYTVTTGLGVLDWAHTVDPTLHLWALTSDTAAHAPLFMSSAYLWLAAQPLSLTRFHSPATALGDRLLDELLRPHDYKTLNPGWKRIADASASLELLLDTDYSEVDSFDWLHALTSLRRATAGFIPALNDRIQDITGMRKLKAYAHTLAPRMASWQLCLEGVYEGFPDTRERERWPRFDPDDLPRGLNAWPDFNPITDFLGDQSQCRQFFAAEDVRLALMRWRSRGKHP